MNRPWTAVIVVEDDSDGQALRLFAQKLGVTARIAWLPAGGIGKIRSSGAALIGLAKARLHGEGCVAVLIDQDGKDPETDEPYRGIARLCKKEGVPLILARESLEAWFLADPGITAWLGVPAPPNTGALRNPKQWVKEAYRRRTGKEYESRAGRLRLARQASGPAAERNVSLAAALEHLGGSGCLPASAGRPGRPARASARGRR